MINGVSNEASLASGYYGPDHERWLIEGYDGGQQTPDSAPSVKTGTPGGLMSNLGNISLAAQGLTGLMGAYNAYQQNKLLKKQFNASLADRNQNIANQARTTNLGLNNQAMMAAQMMGHSAGSKGYNDYIDKNRVQVDGSPINV